MSVRFPEYELYDSVGLAELIHRKEFSAEEILETAIERIELLNPFVNAVTYKMYESARDQIKNNTAFNQGPLAGVPYLLKDLGVSYQAVPTSCGSRWLKNYTRPYHSELTQRYLKAGLIILGKTNTPEFGLMPVTEPEFTGLTKNPWNLTRTAGGSSGGSAAAVASRMLPAAQGGDAGGSIRIPASCCGLFGLKPTRGRTPMGPDRGRSWLGLGVEHALTRSVRDSAVLLDITLGDDSGTPSPLPSPSQSYLDSLNIPVKPLKIGLIEKPFFKVKVHENCITAVQDAAKLCTSLGHHIESTELNVDSERLLRAFTILFSASARAGLNFFRELLKGLPEKIESTTKIIAALGKLYSADELIWAMDTLDQITRRVGKWFEQYDIMLTPTLAAPPIPHGQTRLKVYQTFILNLLNFTGPRVLFKHAVEKGIASGFAFSPYTLIANITGQPAMSVPLYWDREGLPIGVQFTAPFGDEMTLFQLARQLELARPWQHRLPSKVRR